MFYKYTIYISNNLLLLIFKLDRDTLKKKLYSIEILLLQSIVNFYLKKKFYY